MKISVSIIGSNGLPGRYGGWDQLMNHLTKNLKNTISFTVYTSSHNAVRGLTHFNDAKIRVVNLRANGIQSIPYDGFSIIESVFKRQDVLLILGVSGCIFLPFARIFSKKIILNIDGAEWKRGKWNWFIKSFLKISEAIGVLFSDIVIADNEVIKNYVFEKYGKQSVLIAYGGDHVRRISMSGKTSNEYRISPKKYAFTVCRIEPENNIELILDTFSKYDLILVIIGNWNNSNFGIELRAKYKSFQNMRLLDPIYDQDRLDEVRGNCFLYIHGHSVGGTNPSLVEAMSLALPCITFDVSYNKETTESKALYFGNSQELLNSLTLLNGDESLRNKIAEDMFEIASRRYRWSNIVESYEGLFASS
ncbi:DUF1972 domain-containing protein [Polynucleobacter asymbioticus]|uniref:DUF1972 domain-containing protein n=1 Tax=Polynucleobacter asymbioticus TaxID=576611 RepID=UPI0008F83A4C|nr:DUF1972 domain-containing protein [Polynucleobacter asymbioticus]